MRPTGGPPLGTKVEAAWERSEYFARRVFNFVGFSVEDFERAGLVLLDWLCCSLSVDDVLSGILGPSEGWTGNVAGFSWEIPGTVDATMLGSLRCSVSVDKVSSGTSELFKDMIDGKMGPPLKGFRYSSSSINPLCTFIIK